MIVNDNGTQRPMTDDEKAAYDVWSAQYENEQRIVEAQAQAQLDAKLSARIKLAALGLTDEEVAALIP